MLNNFLGWHYHLYLHHIWVFRYSFYHLAIVNKTPFHKNPETISDYFDQGSWQVMIIELLYIAHLLSAFPQYSIISK